MNWKRSSKEILMNKEILALIEDLGWEYDRMSSSGQEAYDKLAKYLEDIDDGYADSIELDSETHQANLNRKHGGTDE